MENQIVKNLEQAAVALDALRKNQETISLIAKAGAMIADAMKNGNSVYSCGNGGSMCDAMHFAEELSGKFRKERRALPAMAISDPAHLSCTANDFGYDAVFSRFVEAHGRSGDVLLAISTSGKSPNIIKAAERARAKGVRVIALTGHADAQLASLADVHIATPGGTDYSDRIQELHIKVIHILIELVEASVFPSA